MLALLKMFSINSNSFTYYTLKKDGFKNGK